MPGLLIPRDCVGDCGARPGAWQPLAGFTCRVEARERLSWSDPDSGRAGPGWRVRSEGTVRILRNSHTVT